MDQEKGIIDYLAQVLAIFGFSILALNLFCLAIGDSAQSLSTMFAMGSKGLTVETMLQYLAISALSVGMRFFFFTDRWIKKMTVPLRTVCMLVAVLLITTVFIIRFGWFPADMWQNWVMFFVCFFLSFLCSYLVMRQKEKAENRKLMDALDRLKEKEGSGDERHNHNR